MTSRRTGRLLLRILLALLLFSALSTIALAVFCRSERGRRFAAAQLEKAVSDNIPGSLRIGSIEQFGPDLVVAKDVRFYHPNGEVVLHAQYAEVVPDWSMALQGRLGFERAAVDGGFIMLAIDPDGRLSMEAAVDAPSKPGEPDDPNGGLHYSLRSMHMQHFTTVLALSSSHPYKVKNTTGFVGIRRIETPGIQVTLEHVAGRVEPDVAGADVALNSVDGWAYGKERHVAHFEVKMGVESGKLDATVDFFDRPKTPLVIKLHKTKGLEATLLSWLLRAGDLLSGDVQVDG
jgi:hypothetical protein